MLAVRIRYIYFCDKHIAMCKEFISFLLHYHFLEHYVPPSVICPLLENAESNLNTWGELLNWDKVAKKYYEQSFQYQRGSSLKRAICKDDKIADRIKCRAVSEIIYTSVNLDLYFGTTKDNPEKQIFYNLAATANTMCKLWKKCVFDYLNDDYGIDFLSKYIFKETNIFQVIELGDLSFVLSDKTISKINTFFDHLESLVYYRTYNIDGIDHFDIYYEKVPDEYLFLYHYSEQEDEVSRSILKVLNNSHVRFSPSCN